MRRGGRGRVTNSLFHRLVVRWKGKCDGRKGIPGIDDKSASNFERQLLDRAGQHAQAIVGQFAREIQREEGSRENLIDQLRINTEKYLAEVSAYERKKRALGRDVTIHLSRGWYAFFVFLIVSGEFALNSQAFDVFQKAPWLTYVMALTVATGLPAVAHFIGIWIKQWPRPAWQTGLKVAVTASVTLACLVGLNIARREYLDALGIQIGEHGQILERAFLLINIFVFLSATVMSYFSHDEDQELENLHIRVAMLDKRLDELNRSIRAAGGQLDDLHQREHSELEEVKGIVLELIHMYRDRNLYARPEGKKPVCFDQEPNIPELKRADEMQKMLDESKVNEINERRRAALQFDSLAASATQGSISGVKAVK